MGVVPHGRVTAVLAAVAVLAEAVVQRLAVAALAPGQQREHGRWSQMRTQCWVVAWPRLPAEVVGVRVHAQEADERVELAHTVLWQSNSNTVMASILMPASVLLDPVSCPDLERRAGEAPLVERGEGEHGVGRGRAAGLDVVRLVQDDAEPRQLHHSHTARVSRVVVWMDLSGLVQYLVQQGLGSLLVAGLLGLLVVLGLVVVLVLPCTATPTSVTRGRRFTPSTRVKALHTSSSSVSLEEGSKSSSSSSSLPLDLRPPAPFFLPLPALFFLPAGPFLDFGFFSSTAASTPHRPRNVTTPIRALNRSQAGCLTWPGRLALAERRHLLDVLGLNPRVLVHLLQVLLLARGLLAALLPRRLLALLPALLANLHTKHRRDNITTHPSARSPTHCF